MLYLNEHPVRLGYHEGQGGIRLVVDLDSGDPELLPVLLRAARSWCRSAMLEIGEVSCEAQLQDRRIVIQASGDKSALLQQAALLHEDLRTEAQRLFDQQVVLAAF